MKAMISLPMRGKTPDEIVKALSTATRKLNDMGYEVINSYNADYDESRPIDEVENIPLFYLSKAIETMSKCDAVYFCEGWDKARGCRIEHECADAYGITMIEA